MKLSDSQVELWEKKATIVEWVNTPLKDRKQSKRGLAQKLGVAIAYIDEIETECKSGSPNPVEDSYDSEKWLQAKTFEVDKALLAACEKGNATALGTYYKLTKRLVEQSETKVKFSLDADELARIEQEARRRNREEGFTSGTGEVSPESPILLKEIREGEGQTQGDNPV